MNFQVRLEPSGRTFDVNDVEPILTQGLKSGFNIPYGCRMGTCCSCRGKILSGAVDLGNAHPAYLPQEQRDEGYALLCQAKALTDVVVAVDELPPIPQPEVSPAIVKATELLAPDVMRLHVRLPLHLNLRFLAGQYVDLLLPGGVRRSYSIANPPQAGGVIDFEFHVRHMSGGLFTDRLFAGLKPREKMQFEGPLGTFFLRESEKPAILIASGTGYAPIRSILLDILPKETGRKITLYWGGRTPADIYLRNEAEALAETYPGFTFIPVISDPRAEDGWVGRTGFVHRAVMEDIPDMSGVQVFACGAPIMVDAARSDFSAHCGLPEGQFFADSFVTTADVAH
ncbi:CDP-4-dehydro-6-deoxyglucose reductase [Sphingobium faniae]|nr:CDP-4-dehydro-6-deoxyglucose reductase [Sphingobium faniae]